MSARDLTLRGRGLDGAALAGALVVAVVVVSVVVGGRREVGLGLGAAELASGGVVGFGGFLGGVEGAEPDAALLAGVPYLGGVTAPWPLPHTPEVNLAGIARLLVLHTRIPRLHNHG